MYARTVLPLIITRTASSAYLRVRLLLPLTQPSQPPKTLTTVRADNKMGYKMAPVSREHGDQVCMRRNLFNPDMHTVHSMMPKRTVVRAQRPRDARFRLYW